MSGCKIHNNSGLEVDNEIHSLVDYTQDRLGFQNPPTIFLDHDEDNSQKTLAKTGYYDPETMEIHIYVTGRHPKDILRSIAHELVHHFQNEKGELTDAGYSGKGYAQKNPHLRNMELQANDPMLFRDWEDSLKENQPTIYNEWRIKNMSTKQWKNQELNRLLLEKFGLKQEYYKGGSGDGSKKGFKSVPGKKGVPDVPFSSDEDEKSEKKEELDEAQYSATDFDAEGVPTDVETSPSPESGGKTYEVWFGPQWPVQLGAHNPGEIISGRTSMDIMKRFGNTDKIVLIKDEEVAKRLVADCGGFTKEVNNMTVAGEDLSKIGWKQGPIFMEPPKAGPPMVEPNGKKCIAINNAIGGTTQAYENQGYSNMDRGWRKIGEDVASFLDGWVPLSLHPMASAVADTDPDWRTFQKEPVGGAEAEMMKATDTTAAVNLNKLEESTKQWKDRQLNENLNKKWGFSMNLNKLKK